MSEFENVPPIGHPLRKLGARLAELLDEDKFVECESLLVECWNATKGCDSAEADRLRRHVKVAAEDAANNIARAKENRDGYMQGYFECLRNWHLAALRSAATSSEGVCK